LDSILVNTPVSSPLHAQLNLPLLKGFLAEQGFSCIVLDSNIHFFREFLGEDYLILGMEDCEKNPLQILSYYNDLEKRLWDKSKSYKGLSVGLRFLSMAQDRIFFHSILKALKDRQGNPFIDYYQDYVESHIQGHSPSIVGIAITFQDQLIPAFTLAAELREKMPDTKIVFGGQMITRCYQSIVECGDLSGLYDYLVLWDGEIPLLDIHRREINGESVDLTNIIPSDGSPYRIEKRAASVKGAELPSPDFSDLDLSDYLFPEMLVPLQTTRGCYARCSFCAIPFGSNRYRVRDAVKVADEIERIQDETQRKYGAKATFFKFMEDTSAPSTLLALSEEIIRRGMDVKWETFARLEKAFAEPGMLERLFEGGCRKIHWGLETNDPAILAEMNKKIPPSYSDKILRLAGEAGILNFCFILIGFPGETSEARQNLVNYVVGNRHIHTLTVASFDLTRNSPMDENFDVDNDYGLERMPAKDFQVRLPYQVGGENWKEKIVFAAHDVLTEIIKRRPDIGFVTLFPDQIRALFCDKFGNEWGREFVERYGEENIRELLLNVKKYITEYKDKKEMDIACLPEPLKREHFRTKEDMSLLAQAILRRQEYEDRRIAQV